MSRLVRIVCSLSFALVADHALAQSTTRVSVDSSGGQANASSNAASISADGRWVAFMSSASNLVAGDTNATTDVFLRDTIVGSTTRISVDSAGVQANGGSFSPVISGDGTRVVFVSDATNLVAGDSNASRDVFVRDLVSGATTRASQTAAGVQANAFSQEAGISHDGRFVVFSSRATNLVIGDTNNAQDIFLKDLFTGAVTRTSVDSAGTQGNLDSSSPVISGNGQFIAFSSEATMLVPSDTNSFSDVFVYDRITASMERTSVATSGSQANRDSYAPRISGDGRFVAFQTSATNLVSGDLNNTVDLFVRDRQLGTTTRASLDYVGQELETATFGAALSSNGRFLAFVTPSPALPGGNGTQHIYLRDLMTSTIVRISCASGGLPGQSSSSSPSVNQDGTWVAFESSANNLIATDSNQASDIFLSDLSSIWAIVCPGDGTATPCPCNNNSPLGSMSGCLNSTGLGAKLDAQGIPSLSSDSFVLRGSQMTNGTCLYIQGTAALNTGLGVVLGDGLRCAGGNVIRLALKVNTSGASQFPDVGDAPVSVQGLCVPGIVQTYQIWHRDGAAFCAPERYGLSNGLSLTWRP